MQRQQTALQNKTWAMLLKTRWLPMFHQIVVTSVLPTGQAESHGRAGKIQLPHADAQLAGSARGNHVFVEQMDAPNFTNVRRTTPYPEIRMFTVGGQLRLPGRMSQPIPSEPETNAKKIETAANQTAKENMMIVHHDWWPFSPTCVATSSLLTNQTESPVGLSC